MQEVLKDLEKRISSALTILSQEVSGVRTSRPSPALVEDLKISMYNQELVLKQLGSVSVVPPRELVVSLWDPSGINQVAKAIEDSKRGFTVSVRGSAIHLNLPPLSAERRAEMVKLLKGIIEKGRIQIRFARDEANKRLEAAEKSKQISEDQKFQAKKKIQDIVDKANKEVETLLAKKEKEILE